ncbi:MAG: DM13 domain-containing protein [Sporichthyaceae bacterium]
MLSGLLTHPAHPRTPGAARLLTVPAVTVVAGAGVFWLGRVSKSEQLAMVLTTAWFAVLTGALAGLWLRRRDLALPFATGLSIVGVAAGYLLVLPQLVDDRVNETVVVGVSAPAASVAESTPVNRNLAQGTFVAQAHPAEGTASLVALAQGGQVLTLTDFATDNGPDLRVYLVPTASGDSVENAVDLGKLKGNIGNQQYTLPADIDPTQYGRVVIWCRAFTVSFGFALLQPA